VLQYHSKELADFVLGIALNMSCALSKVRRATDPDFSTPDHLSDINCGDDLDDQPTQPISTQTFDRTYSTAPTFTQRNKRTMDSADLTSGSSKRRRT
jgi:hypothetical protein